VGDLAGAGDPAYGIVKTLFVEYIAAGKTANITGKDPDTVTLGLPGSALPAEILCEATGHLRLAASEPGSYEWVTASGKTNRAEISRVTPPKEISGSWEVSFDPRWGGPENITFDSLADWSQRPEDGIKFYSGTAVYRKSFEVPSPGPLAGQKYFLELGVVKNLARIKLNGRDLGVVWCAPWRVETGDALKAGINQLEIEVANLWPNRLIGDLSLPAEKRFAWTTRNPFKKNSPLLPSGLLGPVRLFSQ
jgi:hypothetical protein